MRYFILCFLLIFSGCTSAGYFITDISSDGKGGLIIQKSKIVYNPASAMLTSEDSKIYNISVK